MVKTIKQMRAHAGEDVGKRGHLFRAEGSTNLYNYMKSLKNIHFVSHYTFFAGQDGTHYNQAGLELMESSTCLCFPSFGIKSVCHDAWLQHIIRIK